MCVCGPDGRQTQRSLSFTLIYHLFTNGITSRLTAPPEWLTDWLFWWPVFSSPGPPADWFSASLFQMALELTKVNIRCFQFRICTLTGVRSEWIWKARPQKLQSVSNWLRFLGIVFPGTHSPLNLKSTASHFKYILHKWSVTEFETEKETHFFVQCFCHSLSVRSSGWPFHPPTDCLLGWQTSSLA